MSKQVFINLPVADLEKSTNFYEKLGFVKNDMFSDTNASAMQWSESITIMLLNHDFYKKFIDGKSIADTKHVSAALLALSFDSKDEVNKFAEAAEQNGGSTFKVQTDMPEDQMYGLEVIDPDGHQWEAMWMSFDDQSAS